MFYSVFLVKKAMFNVGITKKDFIMSVILLTIILSTAIKEELPTINLRWYGVIPNQKAVDQRFLPSELLILKEHQKYKVKMVMLDI